MQKTHVFENDKATFRWVCDVCECVYSLDVEGYNTIVGRKEELERTAEQLLAGLGCGEITKYTGGRLDLCGECFKDVDEFISRMYNALVTECVEKMREEATRDDDEDEDDE